MSIEIIPVQRTASCDRFKMINLRLSATTMDYCKKKKKKQPGGNGVRSVLLNRGQVAPQVRNWKSKWRKYV